MGDDLSFGRWLKQLRRAAGLTQEELAERAACSPESVRKIEAGRMRPSRSLADLLAVALEIADAERAAFVRRARAAYRRGSAMDLDPAPAQAGALQPFSHLPLPPTPLIGRDTECADAVALLRRANVRLLVLTGPPGSGKTHLSLQLGREVQRFFADGVVFVPLGLLQEARQVPEAIAAILDLREHERHPLLVVLADYLRSRQLLIILDTLEHLPDAGMHIVSLLAGASALKILVTSRTVLHLRGEYDLAVPPLPVPALEPGTPVAQLSHNPAVQVFSARAQAANPAFRLDEQTAPRIATICAQLDGLPLALELAAARLRVLPLTALSALLTTAGGTAPLDALTGGARDLPPQQQTLRRAMAWSYELLPAAIQELFSQVAVFAGGFTLAAAQAVRTPVGSGDDLGTPISVDWGLLGDLSVLVESSLLRQVAFGEDEPRFEMLATLRQYAIERAGANLNNWRERHARYYLHMAESVALRGAAQGGPLFSRLIPEQENVRAALLWADEHGQSEIMIRLARALVWFWDRQGRWSEGQRWCERALAMTATGESDRQLRAELLESAGWLAWRLGDQDRARARLLDSLTIYQRLAAPEQVSQLMRRLGLAALDRGEIGAAIALLDEGLATYHQLDGVRANLLNARALAALYGADYARARALGTQSMTLCQELDEERPGALARAILGFSLLCQDEGIEAGRLLADGFLLAVRADHRATILLCLAGVASAAIQEEPLRATQLMAALEEARSRAQLAVPLAMRTLLDRWQCAAGARLDPARWTAAWAAGRQRSWAWALEEGAAQAEQLQRRAARVQTQVRDC